MKRLTAELGVDAARAFQRESYSRAGFEMVFCQSDKTDEILQIGKTCFDYNPPTRREIVYALDKAHAGIFALQHSEKLAGYLLVEAHAGRQSLYFNTTAILPKFRGQGLGAILYAFVDFLCPRMEARSVWCHVAVNNEKTIHLLEKYGYAKTNTIEDYYDDSNAAHVMKKVFA